MTIVEGGRVEGYDAGQGPWLVQPLVESVRTEGETSVFVFGGRPAGQVRKVPGVGSILVHEHLGGEYAAVPLDAEATDLAVRAVAAGEREVERPLTYARVQAAAGRRHPRAQRTRGHRAGDLPGRRPGERRALRRRRSRGALRRCSDA